MACISLAVHLLHYMALRMQIEQVVFMTASLQRVTLFFLWSYIDFMEIKQTTHSYLLLYRAEYKALAEGTAEVIWL